MSNPANMRSRPLDELGDPDAPIGSRSWSLWLANEIRKTLYDNQQTGTRLRYLVDTFKEHAGWQELGFLTWEDFCAKRLQTESGKVEAQPQLPGFEKSTIVDAPETPAVEGCKLGHALGVCPLQRVGCGSYFEALMYVMPPWHVRIYIREALANDKEAQAWLRRLDDVVPGARPSPQKQGWR